MSSNSKRVLDLVGWLVVYGRPAEIDVFHVLAPLLPKEMVAMWTGLVEMAATIEQRLVDDAEDALSQAKTYLTEKGAPPFMVTSHLETEGTDESQAILKKAKEGDFGAVIVGRRGISRTKRFLFGSVSHRIVQEARNMAVWVVC
jgi:nucleotide-binding universal stress UspA family protein